MEITENIENEAEAARSPGEVKKEIRKLRHKAERPLYWILFVMNILILLCAFVFTMAKYSLQGTTQGRYLTGGVPPIRFSM